MNKRTFIGRYRVLRSMGDSIIVAAWWALRPKSLELLVKTLFEHKGDK